jgi:hypothetical protein
MQLKLIIALLLIGRFETLSQVSVIDYKETNNTINILLELNRYNDEELSGKIYDESIPGNLALPFKNVIIGIPFGQEPEINYHIKESKTFKYNPHFNPVTVLMDSAVRYFFPDPVKPPDKKSVIELNGYLWIDNIYCMDLNLNKYSYDYDQRKLTEITKLEIVILFPKNISAEMLTVNYNTDNNHLILNYQNALKFAKERPQFKTTDTSSTWIDFSKTYVKIKTGADGIYRIKYEDLQRVNIPVTLIDPGTMNIYCNAVKIPIHIKGESDKSFDPGDYIEFIGQRQMGSNYKNVSNYDESYNEYLGRYSDTTVYWLTWNDTDPLRAENSNGLLNSSDTLDYYSRLLHIEKDNWFDYSTDNLVRREHPFWIENKTWGWHSISPGVQNYNFTAADIYRGPPVTISAKLQGYASSIIDNAHLIGISLNSGSVQDSGYINKYSQKVLHAEVNTDLLLEGNNILRISSYPTASDVNLLFFDWYEIEYPAYLNLNKDSLNFSFPFITSERLATIKIKNTRGSNYAVWRKGLKYERYFSYEINNGELYLTDTISANDKYYIIKDDMVSSPLIELPKQFNNLRNREKQADYIIITHKNFLMKAVEYAEFINTSYGLTTSVIDIDDIYDEFSYGGFNPEAIRGFLQATHLYWQSPLPEYVLLVGDGTYDYHRNKEKNLGNPPVNNYVPSFGAPVSDNWFVIWDTTGANIPSINIGRLPVNNENEITGYLNRHRNYLLRGQDDWNKKYLFFSGGLGNNQQELDQLREVNQNIIDNYIEPEPIGGRSTHFFKTINPTTNYGPYSPAEISEAITGCGLFISYIGHSGTQTWDNGIVDPAQIANNRGRYPLITDFGCSTGKFAEPDIVSFSELFINKGEAIAYISNSSLGFYSTSTLFPQIFYKKLLIDSVKNISEAHKLAKIEMLQNYGTSGTYSLFSLTNLFFGDPVIELPLPDKPDLFISADDFKMNNINPDDRTEFAKGEITIFNHGKVTGDSISILIEDNYKNNVVYKDTIKGVIPSYSRKTDISIPIKDMGGEHIITIKGDPENILDEINEDNNTATLIIYVSNASLRLLNNYSTEYSIKDTLTILNPVYSPGDSKILLEYSSDKSFAECNSKIYNSDRFVTNVNLRQLCGSGRFWIRGKFSEGDSYSFVRSVFIGDEEQYLLNDSLSFSTADLKNISVTSDGIALDSAAAGFTVISAGFNDGKTAVISKDGQTFVPGGNTIGHHVCLFRQSDLSFVEYRRFNVYSETTAAAEYYSFLDTLTSDYLVMIAVNDEGRVPDSLKRKLYEFGSIYIDSLAFRSSWGIIGVRGAPRGSVPEAFKHAFHGKVKIDTTVNRMSNQGSFISTVIGPAAEWKKFTIQTTADSSALKIYPIIGKDTLRNIFSGEEVSLINEIIPPGTKDIKLLGEIRNPVNGTVPFISSLGLNYTGLPELILSRKGALITDTVETGETTFGLQFFNAGERFTGEFKLLAEMVNENISRDTLFAEKINLKNFYGDSLFLKNIFIFGEGKKILFLHIDSDDDITEVYEDNNILQIPLYVKRDTEVPSIEIKFDGKEVFDNDFVSPDPIIKIRLFDNYIVPAGDTSFIKIFINDKKVSSEQMKFTWEGRSCAEVEFYATLASGEQFLRVEYKDQSGNAGYKELRVVVTGECRLKAAYNYPDPFISDTYFTFILTSIPDHIRINIYTIAGRLIKKIITYPAQLSANFNSIYWDGKDEDGNNISNGVYLYKIILTKDGRSESIINKMVKVR